jgi:hypothetical protein
MAIQILVPQLGADATAAEDTVESDGEEEKED